MAITKALLPCVATVLVTLSAGPAAAVRPAYEVKATASQSCAPWDGRAVQLKILINPVPAVPDAGTILYIDLWRNGLDKLASGGSVALGAGNGFEGDGQLRLCTGNADCHSAAGHLELKPAAAGAPVSGDVFWSVGDQGQEATVPFVAPWENNGPQICG